MEEVKVGDYYKHFKGKNIYRILTTNVTYTGTNANKELNNLVVYQNIIDGKVFVREANELFEELDEDRQKQYNQKHRIEKISEKEALSKLRMTDEEER